MFQTVPCSSSGGQIVLLKHLVSSVSVNSCPVRWLRADGISMIIATTLFMYQVDYKKL